jgi:hypothetical protein
MKNAGHRVARREDAQLLVGLGAEVRKKSDSDVH